MKHEVRNECMMMIVLVARLELEPNIKHLSVIIAMCELIILPHALPVHVASIKCNFTDGRVSISIQVGDETCG